MAEHQNPKKPSTTENPPPSTTSKPFNEVKNANSNGSTTYSGQKVRYPNPPDAMNPDPATLKEQWRYAIRQYSRWYSQAWGTAILAGVSFFALGWIIKGSNPLPSFRQSDDQSTALLSSSPSVASSDDETRR